ncbi:MAG: M48 family peptidase [Acidobacteria bacterium]|nr:M48 family peptidase [Acidobacteriota bacterium]
MQVECAPACEAARRACAQVFARLRPRTPIPPIEVEFCRFANADSYIRLADGRLHLRITDLLSGAPSPVLEALLYILLGKLLRKPVPGLYTRRYRAYFNRQEVRRSVHLVRQARGRKFISDPQGSHYHLEEVFEALNVRFFHGLLARPRLGWSRRPSRTTLGHFDLSHNAIVISKLLDRAEAPRLALDYVMFHEMLHLRYPSTQRGAWRRVHTKDLRHAERAFPNLKEAKDLLKKLCLGTPP